MSVPPGDRNKSPMDFVEVAGTIETRAMQVCRRWPKSYMFIITQRTINLASEIYEHVQRANAIMPQTEAERTERIIELERALGANYAFARKIERAYSLFPICGEKKDESAETMQEKSSKILAEFMGYCLAEEDAIKGNLHYTRNMSLDGKRPRAKEK